MRPWLFFLTFTLQRQARARLMVWVSLGLLGIVALLVHLNTRFDRWNMGHWRLTLRQLPMVSDKMELTRGSIILPPPPKVSWAETLQCIDLLAETTAPRETGSLAVAGAIRSVVYQGAALRIFSSAIVVSLLASFLLPLWTLTFATESLGRARENRTLTWLLLRPVPRPGMYLAGYLAALPWCLALNLGGYVLFGFLGGDIGRQVLAIYWPPLLMGTLAFAALFQFLSILVRRAGIIGLLYAFFFETIASQLPGQQKRLSISYYMRCWMVERAQDAGLTLDIAGARPPVSASAALWILLAATVGLLIAGVVLFSRKEFVDTGN